MVFSDIDKSHDVHLLKMTQYKKVTVWKFTYTKLTHRKLVTNQMFQIPINNDQGHRYIIHHNNVIKLLMLC